VDGHSPCDLDLNLILVPSFHMIAVFVLGFVGGILDFSRRASAGASGLTDHGTQISEARKEDNGVRSRAWRMAR
jgi:hypothetical protein